jgi:hypothetical protein
VECLRIPKSTLSNLVVKIRTIDNVQEVVEEFIVLKYICG